MNITVNLLNEIEDSISSLPILKVTGTWSEDRNEGQLDKTLSEINTAIENSFLVLFYLQFNDKLVYLQQSETPLNSTSTYFSWDGNRNLIFKNNNNIVFYSIGYEVS